ncbi:uncharacterized protein EDB91DRAFT_1335451 [Suillus paluster]|uniref:uncharacterized protein n=1 Tax=Suillus paluster TaxID=48578 RepID=UPI001B8765F8|nr:uncharacterized protein EDB91DRAFT_1335451 [Suillus paluster]KAG1744979.1 hypothetical protein EDB91DRAFT_1335451 [Suillus paluster]
MKVTDYLAEPLINRLPVELLQQIFLLVVNDVPDYPGIFSFGDNTISANVTSPPLLLTQVCCCWRAIAHSTRGLWSRILVTLPGRERPLKPFLPFLLESWLARSGSHPLSLSIVSKQLFYPRHHRAGCRPLFSYPSEADSQLLGILLSEKGRWETLVVVSPDICDWSDNIDAPQLRTLECFRREFKRFDAPNLHRLQIFNQCEFSVTTPTCETLQHLRLHHTSVNTIRFTSVIFPHLETLAVDDFSVGSGDRIDSVTQSCLKSMTLPLRLRVTSDPYYRQGFINILDGFHLPMLQKLTVEVGDLKKPAVDCIMEALAVASCHEPAVDFQTTTPSSEVDMDIFEPLLSVVKEVTVCGEVLR